LDLARNRKVRGLFFILLARIWLREPREHLYAQQCPNKAAYEHQAGALLTLNEARVRSSHMAVTVVAYDPDLTF
jgi:hypothetical protein